MRATVRLAREGEQARAARADREMACMTRANED